MKYFKFFIVVLCLLAGSVVAVNQRRDVIVRVETPPLPWMESKVADKIQAQMSQQTDFNVFLTHQLNDKLPAYPAARYNIDSLINWGLETGHRYLMAVYIFDERLEKRKTFSIPLVIHMYETIGVIEGEFLFIDITGGRQLAAESFKVRESAKRIFQASIDDDIYDPSLHLASPEKIKFFDALEKKLVKHLVSKVKKYNRAR